MAISPNDFSLWARLTGNKYPSTPAERAKKGPEVHNFIQNLDKEGMLGGKEPEQPKKEKNLAEKVATGALIAGGVAAAVAAGRDKRVQDVAQKAASATKTKIDDFLSNLGKARVVDVDIVDASGDVTPDPRQQQSNVGSQVNKFLTAEKTAEEIMGPRRQHPIDAPDQKRARYMQKIIQYNMNVKFLQLLKDEHGIYAEREYIQEILDKRKKPVTAKDTFKPAVEGKTFGTSGAISKLEDIRCKVKS